MNSDAERDTKKSIDRLATSTSTTSSSTFNLVDKSAKALSNIKTKSEEEIHVDNQNTESFNSRLKTTEKDNETINESSTETVNNQSRIKTNANFSDNVKVSEVDDNSKVKTNRIKTSVSKVANKTFKFNSNQGKFSKTITVVSKTGEKVSRTGRTITRTSRELNKAISNDGTGTEYINDKIGRKIKTKGYRIAKKGANKVKRKFNQTLGKKLAQVAKAVVIKLLKMLISLFAALSEFIIPIALVILIVVAIGSIFGSGSTDSKTISNYSTYMKSIQQEYDKKVDDWKKQNPDGIVVGVKGEYGQIDWRIPLAIMQSTNAELSLDKNEKDLLEAFKKANLLEKHEVQNQKIESENDLGEVSEKEIPVLVITNGVYEDYMEWCKNNYSVISSFNKQKKVSDGLDTWFSIDQLDLLDMLYQSDDYAELLGSDFKTSIPSFGSNTTQANLKSKYYNSENTLTISGFKGQCTWYSFGRALEVSGKKMPTGNAQTWLSSAVAMGYKTGTQPSVNSVVVLMGRKFGHVAYVESYDGKSITISEGNVGNPCSNDDSCSAVDYAVKHADEMVRTKTYQSFDAYRKASKSSGLTIVGFIYLD